MLIIGLAVSLSICGGHTKNNSNLPVSEVPIKQAKGRLKAIARGYMVENQKNTNPFELHQNWRFIKKDIYKKLEQESYLDKQKQRVINEDVMPTMTDKVFKKLADLDSDQRERRKKYVQSPDLITVKESESVVRDRLRKHNIAINDRELLFDEIVLQLKTYVETDNMISKKLTKTIADEIIIKFKMNKLNIQSEAQKSYLQEFISGWYKRFSNQIKTLNLNAIE